MLRRPDDGHVSTEKYSENLLTGLLRRTGIGHERNENNSEQLFTEL
jgi:hypothetical protein